MKHQRVIHILADGRRKYATYRGEILRWHELEIEALRLNHERFGDGAFTLDFMCYAVEVKELRSRYPRAKIVRVVGFEHEDHDLPINPKIIF